MIILKNFEEYKSWFYESRDCDFLTTLRGGTVPE